ncbi:hypothetical protein CPB84DRAFT_1789843 [Gymnopilus junonius]|uniref:Hydrophobin n=1 Tax=Gymnopilus junonius TaxID=109634 RepID=A0A9P5TI26_GYMJU|nr:hypothetical protein CPB84DRAFT_1789843 [Gymnopilus junonius]
MHSWSKLKPKVYDIDELVITFYSSSQVSTMHSTMLTGAFLTIFLALSLSASGNVVTRQILDPCTGGELECCSSVLDVSTASTILGLLGIPVPTDLTGLVGFGCTPVPSILGLPIGSCSNQLECCTTPATSPGIAFGCTPVTSSI